MKWDKITILIAAHSKCKKKMVGAVIHKEGRIIATGWNGTPSGMDNACEEHGVTKAIVVHAEANAILFAAKHGTALAGTTLVCTLSPCVECAKMIIQSGITKVEYLEEYRDTLGLDILRSAGVDLVLHCNVTN